MVSTISSAVNALTSGAAATTSGASSSDVSIAKNFSTFLQLLTTQLQHQNPLEPLDTNQFTQQLVQFAQVEQQINMNGSLEALVQFQKASQESAAVGFLGATVRVEGNTARFTGSPATWTFSAERPGTATITVRNAAGETVYSENRTIQAGSQQFVWNGTTSSGAPSASGDYTISVVALDAAGRSVAVSTDVDGVVDGVDLTQSPPLLWIGDQSFTLDKVKQVRRAGA